MGCDCGVNVKSASSMALLITGFCVIGCAKVVNTAELARRQASFRDRLPLEVRLEADKPEYRVGDTITFAVTVSNPTARPVTFFNDNKWTKIRLWPTEQAKGILQRGNPPFITYGLPDGSEVQTWSEIPLPDFSTRDTVEVTFTQLTPGGEISSVVSMKAVRAGEWEANTWLYSKQNYLVTEHSPFPRFGLAWSDEYWEEKEAFDKHVLGMEAAGWRWDEDRSWFEKIKSGVHVGWATSNGVVLTVRTE